MYIHGPHEPPSSHAPKLLGADGPTSTRDDREPCPCTGFRNTFFPQASQWCNLAPQSVASWGADGVASVRSAHRPTSAIQDVQGYLVVLFTLFCNPVIIPPDQCPPDPMHGANNMLQTWCHPTCKKIRGFAWHCGGMVCS